MTTGKVKSWNKKEGDKLIAGDILCEIETDKATMEFEAVDAGRIGKILIAEGTEGVAVNKPIAILLEEGEDMSMVKASAAPTAKAAAPVLPVRIHGTYEALARGAKCLHPATITLVVGDLYKPDLTTLSHLPPKDLYKHLADEVMTRIAALPLP